MVTELSDRRRRVLLVEDDTEIAEMLEELLTSEGYQVETAQDGQRGLHLSLTRTYDVLIIDRVLPAIDGLDLIRRIRRKGIATPVLVLTALGTVADRVAGLDSGAEDYVMKPFEIEELLARIRALVRRHRDAECTLPLGAAEIDLVRRKVRLPDGAEVELSKREFQLLRALASRPHAVYSREELQLMVFEDTAADSIVDTYVHYLRRKLGREVVHTIRGFGYRLGEL